MKLETKSLPDGFSEYRTKEGDLVDQIAFAFYGTHAGTTEILYDDNPHLLRNPMILPANLIIRLRPKPPAVSSRPTINLWD